MLVPARMKRAALAVILVAATTGSASAGGRYDGVAPDAALLSARSTLRATDLLPNVPAIDPATLTFHLKNLLHAGMVEAEQRGGDLRDVADAVLEAPQAAVEHGLHQVLAAHGLARLTQDLGCGVQTAPPLRLFRFGRVAGVAVLD